MQNAQRGIRYLGILVHPSQIKITDKVKHVHATVVDGRRGSVTTGRCLAGVKHVSLVTLLRGGREWRYSRHCCRAITSRQYPLIVTDSSCQRARLRAICICMCALGFDTYSESDGVRACRGRITSTSRTPGHGALLRGGANRVAVLEYPPANWEEVQRSPRK